MLHTPLTLLGTYFWLCYIWSSYVVTLMKTVSYFFSVAVHCALGAGGWGGAALQSRSPVMKSTISSCDTLNVWCTNLHTQWVVRSLETTPPRPLIVLPSDVAQHIALISHQNMSWCHCHRHHCEGKTKKKSSSLLCLAHFLFIIIVSQRTLGLQCSISIFSHKESLLCFVLCREITHSFFVNDVDPSPQGWTVPQFRTSSDASAADGLPFPSLSYGA